MKAIPNSNRSICKRLTREIKSLIKPEFIVQVRRRVGRTYFTPGWPDQYESDTNEWWVVIIYMPHQQWSELHIENWKATDLLQVVQYNILNWNPEWLR